MARKRSVAPASWEPIVQRELEVVSNGKERRVVVRLRMPVPVGEAEFRCDFAIDGFRSPISAFGSGVDAIQAYENALGIAALHLLASSTYQGGQLTFQGSYDLRLPVSDSYQLLVRTDLERDRLVREISGKDPRSERFSEARLARLQDTSTVRSERPGDAPVILERRLELRRRGKRTTVRVAFHRPVPHRIGHWCAFSIDGLFARPHARTMMAGEDSIEALGNAMRLAMVHLVSSPAYQRGELTWIGMHDLGLPIFEEIKPLVRQDRHAKLLVHMMMNPLGMRGKPRK